MTYMQALELSIKKWIWLFKNPDKNKEQDDSPVWNKIKDLQNLCALCHLFLGVDKSSPVVMCGKCPLNSERNNCFYEWSPCYKWSTFPEIRKQCASRVVCILQRELREERRNKYYG